MNITTWVMSSPSNVSTSHPVMGSVRPGVQLGDPLVQRLPAPQHPIRLDHRHVLGVHALERRRPLWGVSDHPGSQVPLDQSVNNHDDRAFRADVRRITDHPDCRLMEGFSPRAASV
ncbi:hypothetical protein [Amycolatopsis sp. NPDC051372]|uniref:hypothetical protein n=1 Tax=unclassified Amycolatopsis TaxID=2618356 RepID=UPI00342F7CF5